VEGQRRIRRCHHAILNAGHRRGQKAKLAVRDGDNWTVRSLEVFGPKALAGIDNAEVPDTIVDRANQLRKLREDFGRAGLNLVPPKA
jgi:hypothetical protein